MYVDFGINFKSASTITALFIIFIIKFQSVKSFLIVYVYWIPYIFMPEFSSLSLPLSQTCRVNYPYFSFHPSNHILIYSTCLLLLNNPYSLFLRSTFSSISHYYLCPRVRIQNNFSKHFSPQNPNWFSDKISISFYVLYIHRNFFFFVFLCLKEN